MRFNAKKFKHEEDEEDKNDDYAVMQELTTDLKGLMIPSA
jgi:hypothetical protein